MIPTRELTCGEDEQDREKSTREEEEDHLMRETLKIVKMGELSN